MCYCIEDGKVGYPAVRVGGEIGEDRDGPSPEGEVEGLGAEAVGEAARLTQPRPPLQEAAELFGLAVKPGAAVPHGALRPDEAGEEVAAGAVLRQAAPEPASQSIPKHSRRQVKV